MGGYLRSYLGAQRPVARPARGGGPFEGPSGPAQGGPCNVVSPADSSGGARLSLEESRRKEHQGGERFSPPWTHLSLVFARREVVFFILPGLRPICPTPVTARPPAGRAGKGRNFGTRCAGLPKLGDAPRPAPAKLALSGREVCFGRRSRSKHDWIFFPRLRAGKLCEACPAG